MSHSVDAILLDHNYSTRKELKKSKEDINGNRQKSNPIEDKLKRVKDPLKKTSNKKKARKYSKEDNEGNGSKKIKTNHIKKRIEVKLKNQFVKRNYSYPGIKGFKNDAIVSYGFSGKGFTKVYNSNDGLIAEKTLPIMIRTVKTGAQSRVLSDRRLASPQQIDFRNAEDINLRENEIPEIAKPEAVYALTHFV